MEKIRIIGLVEEEMRNITKVRTDCNGPRTTMAYLKRKRIILNKT
jgi:hypothetical protein